MTIAMVTIAIDRDIRMSGTPCGPRIPAINPIGGNEVKTPSAEIFRLRLTTTSRERRMIWLFALAVPHGAGRSGSHQNHKRSDPRRGSAGCCHQKALQPRVQMLLRCSK